MKAIAASAPGKVLLSGEYAVLAGAPAICAAVDRRAVAAVSRSDTGSNSAVSTTMNSQTRLFRCGTTGQIEWQDDRAPAESPGLLECVWRQFDMPANRPIALSLDSHDFFDETGNHKLGLGSSAAVCVAIATAFAELTGDTAALADKCFDAHSEFQESRGSGVDVATSLHGGLISYRMHDTGSISQLRWPQDLEMQLYWSGSPSSTTGKLKLLEQKPDLWTASRSASNLVRAATELAGAWEDATATDLLSSLANYVTMLDSFSLDHALGIFDARHDELVEMAKMSNVVYKPSGAGGGDIGVAFASSAADIDSFSRLAMEAGFSKLDLSLDSRGASLDVMDDQ